MITRAGFSVEAFHQVASNEFSGAAGGFFNRFCLEVQRYMGCLLDLFHAAQIKEIFASIFHIFKFEVLWLFFFRLLALDRLMELHIIVIHGFPFRSLDTLEG